MDQQLPEQPNFTQPKADDEITLKDIILKIQEWWSIVWPQRTKIIALSLAIGLVAALYTKFIAKPTYTARTNYSLKKKAAVYEQRDALGLEFRLRHWWGISLLEHYGAGVPYLANNISHAMTRRAGRA